MPAFDWKGFLDNYNIEYSTHGHNIGRNWLGLACPFCGDDPSQHLGVNIIHGGWHCWRRHHPGGRRPHNLVMALIGCSYDTAEAIVERGILPDSNYGDLTGRINVDLLFNNKVVEIENRPKSLELMPEFRSIVKSPLADLFATPYIQDRGYSFKETIKLAKRYNLHFAMNGFFSYRVIFPITYYNDLVTWTGRTVVKNQKPRYSTLSKDVEQSKKLDIPVALESIKNCLFDFDYLCSVKGGTLVLTEGPFDACRISFFGEEYGIYGTGSFSVKLTTSQIALLDMLSRRFDRFYILADEGAVVDSFMYFPKWLKFKPLELPRGVNDPAELNEEIFTSLFLT